MKFFGIFLSALAILAGTNAFAAQFGDYDFEQDRMILNNNSVLVFSSFETEDRITAYSHNGKLQWEVPFHAKVVAWRMSSNDYLFVFSKGRSGSKTYLTCLDAYTGALAWQKP